ncbi:hypothetical protein F8M41_026017 [Gigaspora margarita]|uniref:Uncharacterized protein n=1 Tax=Gigaspora margarita TaxID=4874 RepID=A0A8H4ABD2_GIGMA|nr:hypothetical protein F8M41_026017 [Gigaspora margarita]
MGDLCDLIGTILQNLLLTTILIALYHSVVDISLLLQIYYYCFHKTPICNNESNESNEELAALESNESTKELAASKISKISIHRSRLNKSIKIFARFIIICLAGGIAYYISSKSQGTEENNQIANEELKLVPQIFGWTAAMFYCK